MIKLTEILICSTVLLTPILMVKAEQKTLPEINIKKIQYRRFQPHTYCEQALAYVKGTNSMLFYYDRVSKISDKYYCVIAYTDSKKNDSNIIRISGQFVKDAHSYQFQTYADGANFENVLNKTQKKIRDFKIIPVTD
jgi:hypothetical protein